jgi:acyl-coenzyme A synthetase/AMP-(fatty) acid ligase
VPIASQAATSMAGDTAGLRAISRRRIIVCALGFIGGGAALTACSTGSSREAERGRARDAERTSVVDNMQATRTASLINGTPPATPSER